VDAAALPTASAEVSLMSAASLVEDFFVETGAASAPGNGAKAPTAKRASRAQGNQETRGGMQKMLQEAFPMDKMQDSMQASLGTAQGFMSWGFSKVVEGATKMSDTVAEVDFAQEAQKFVQKTDEAIQMGAEEVSKLTEAATNQARVIGQDFETTTLRPGLEQTAQAAELANKKASEFAEQMQPKLLEAHEKAKKGLFKAASTAAATAIWFQSLGSAGMESGDEASTGKTAEDASKAAERQQAEQTPSARQQRTETAEATEGPSGFQFHPELRQSVATGSTAPCSAEESTAGGESAKCIASSAITTGMGESAQQENATALEAGTAQDATSDSAEKTEPLAEGPKASQEARADTEKYQDDTVLF